MGMERLGVSWANFNYRRNIQIVHLNVLSVTGYKRGDRFGTIHGNENSVCLKVSKQCLQWIYVFSLRDKLVFRPVITAPKTWPQQKNSNTYIHKGHSKTHMRLFSSQQAHIQRCHLSINNAIH